MGGTTLKHRLIALGAMAAFCLAVSTFASVDFCGYRKVVTISWDPVKETHDTTIEYDQVKLGYSQLEITDITIVPNGNYVDVTEDAYISSSVTNMDRPDLTGDFLFRGFISVPRRAVVTGLHTWIGDVLFRGTLAPTQYAYDLSFKDTTALRKLLDNRLILFQQLDATLYELTLAHIRLGERKHVRIRYLLPNDGGGTSLFNVPVLFNPDYGARPKYCTIRVNASPKDVGYYLETANGVIKITDTLKVVVPYQPQFRLRNDRKETSVLHMTAFGAGPWQGHYVLMNAALTDSTVGRLSRPIDAVFVWRWNLPMRIVGYVNGLKGLTQYGRQVIAQAEKMKTAMKDLSKRGYRCGLIHTLEGQPASGFRTDSLTLESGPQAIAYLDSFAEQQLYNAYQYQADALPPWSVTEAPGQTVVQASRNEFVSMLIGSSRLLYDTSVTFRHIVLESVGDGSLGEKKSYRELVDSLLKKITVDYTTADWRGIDVAATFLTPYDQNLTMWGAYYFPLFRATSIVLSVATETQPYLFTFKGWAADSTAISARTMGAWDTVFHWTGYDDKGEVTGRFVTTPLVYRVDGDSGLAKLWARDDSHISEKEEVYPSGVFGIVTKASYLQAGPGSAVQDTSATVPFLRDYEILPRPVDSIEIPYISVRRQVVAPAREDFSAELRRGVLSVTFPRPITSIEVFDLRGRLMARFDAAALQRSGNTVRVLLPKRTGCSVYVVKIIGKGFVSHVRVFEKGGR
jgi:hypothetical protein